MCAVICTGIGKEPTRDVMGQVDTTEIEHVLLDVEVVPKTPLSVTCRAEPFVLTICLDIGHLAACVVNDRCPSSSWICQSCQACV
jgi:hypothetical protein